MCRFCFHEAMLQLQEQVSCQFKRIEARLDIMLMEMIRQIRDDNDRRK